MQKHGKIKFPKKSSLNLFIILNIYQELFTSELVTYSLQKNNNLTITYR